jgi:hypothetical protein
MTGAKMTDVTDTQFERLINEIASLKDGQREIRVDLKLLETRVSALPDKAEIYRATFGLHGIIWAAIATTSALFIALANSLGWFNG